ncbi:hypothetical protein BAUCODRAFT_127475 [Baudoinia panamericana UAMH 10762]|uniref:Uncharacterized protein n=1 Tax=Baudoinia panamericana (strain UAMH 10762) TaxID=717646 RepID=M2MWM1_BAUPA|nr:uncharacterized protein BAUCODRAFT_127475 [Baudoinia panamericana UAMH 10762]EMC90984.1 hypothetical protein BAUCODRAFT_127475 [Baudoinia panamericana UAMH 10762]
MSSAAPFALVGGIKTGVCFSTYCSPVLRKFEGFIYVYDRLNGLRLTSRAGRAVIATSMSHDLDSSPSAGQSVPISLFYPVTGEGSSLTYAYNNDP